MLLRRMLIMLGAVVLVVGALATVKINSFIQMNTQLTAPRPPISVAAAQAEEHSWPSRLPGIGTLKAFQGVDLTVEVDGTVKDLLFRSGEKVSLNQPIAQLDNAVEQASLAAAEAEQNLARVEFERGHNLVNYQAISKSAFDRLAAELQKANANVAQLRAILAKKRILAPFAGTIGIRQVDVGDYVSSGTPLATLQDLSALFVDFYLPEQAAPQLSVGQKVRLRVAAYPGEVFEGEIAAINPKVEDSTRNLQVRAKLTNPQGKLLPGMFTNLEVLLANQTLRVIVPETAITYTLYGNAVYVIGEQKNDLGEVQKDDQGQPLLVVERRFVKTGERRDGQVVILENLQVGERVVTAGQLKLDHGARVAIVTEQAEQA
ncbi:Multidrug efflux system, membrane fusion component MexV [Pseudomonas chlororaphis]|uniref:Multidrug efflux system, membrane fusion component MexV n=1 Tax=Pseudomonas chlororaphis TaxID=587753 RepID=A0A3G7TNV7_9PSED|nr:efflux RND transporter periplasmic adaptor subunit [Pseudomonas chlororaphis]AZE48825.1 Multidrug efflux system, membrane fusion component MexV [Pseudomonas chlororaphis]